MAFGKKKQKNTEEKKGFEYKPREFDREERIALQKIVSNIPVTRKLLNQQMIEQATFKYVSQNIQVGSAAAKNVNTTLYPQVFFDSFKKLISSTENLVKIEPYWRFEGQGPTDQLNEINEKRDKIIKGFIYESFNALIDQISKKRSNSAKQKLFDEYQATLMANTDICGEENFEYFKLLVREKFGGADESPDEIENAETGEPENGGTAEENPGSEEQPDEETEANAADNGSGSGTEENHTN